MSALVLELESVEVRRQALLAQVASLDDSTRTRRPAEGAWSILEVVEHLLRAEGAVFPADSEGSAKGRSMKNRLLYWLVLGILRFGIKVQAPSRAMLPTGGRSFAELRSEWDRSQGRLRAYLERLDAGEADTMRFRHPVTGPMPAADAVRMLGIHLDTHQRQIDGILTELESSAA